MKIVQVKNQKVLSMEKKLNHDKFDNSPNCALANGRATTAKTKKTAKIENNFAFIFEFEEQFLIKQLI